MAPGRIRSIDEAIERLYELKVGVIGTAAGDRHERPHKPALLLAVLDLIADGQAHPGAIPWSRALRRRFDEYFAQVRSHDDQATPQNPFRFLRSDAIWAPTEIIDGQAVPLRREPRVNECDTGGVSAALTGGLEDWVLTPSNRTLLRRALVARYFPQARPRLAPLFRDVDRPERVADGSPGDAAAARERAGRSRGFRNKVLEIYDHQCAACGLRINVPGVPDGTFVDAAHLIPFAESGSDHPSNGLALCKNHHWAMDRFLIAPGTDGAWRTSPRLIPHRSPGEQSLAGLRGQAVLAPREVAFMPALAALDWRCSRLLT